MQMLWGASDCWKSQAAEAKAHLTIASSQVLLSQTHLRVRLQSLGEAEYRCLSVAFFPVYHALIVPCICMHVIKSCCEFVLHQSPSNLVVLSVHDLSLRRNVGGMSLRN